MSNLARRPRLLIGPVVLFLSTGCKPVEEAPTEMSDVLTGLWTQWDVGTDDELGALALDMAEVLDEDADVADGAVLIDGFQDRLDQAAQDAVDLYPPPDDDGSWEKPDIAKARPVFLAKRFTCDLDRLQEILVALNQDELYPNEYNAYERSYTTSIEDFEASTADRVSWKVDLDKTYLVYRYTGELEGGVRRIPLPDTSEVEAPPAWAGTDYLLARTWIPYPAQPLKKGLRFQQDYQIEAYVPWEGGDIVHLYGVWRELEFAESSVEEEGLARLMLNALAAWDDQTEKNCAE